LIATVVSRSSSAAGAMAMDGKLDRDGHTVELRGPVRADRPERGIQGGPIAQPIVELPEGPAGESPLQVPMQRDSIAVAHVLVQIANRPSGITRWR